MFRSDSGCRSVKSEGIPSGKQERGGEGRLEGWVKTQSRSLIEAAKQEFQLSEILIHGI